MPVVLTSDLFVAGDLTITGDDFDANGFDVTVTGNLDWSSSGTLLGGTGTWDIGQNVTISAGTTNLEASNWVVGGDLDITGTAFTGIASSLTLTGTSGTQDLNFDGNSMGGIFIDAAGATKRFTSNFNCTRLQHRAGIMHVNARTIVCTGYFHIFKNATTTGLGGSNITVNGALRIFGSTLNPVSSWVLNVTTPTPRIGGTPIARMQATGTTIIAFNCTDGGSNTNVTFVTGDGTGGITLAGESLAEKHLVIRGTGGLTLSNALDPTLIDVTIYPALDFTWDVPTIITVSQDITWNVGSQDQKWYRVVGKCIEPNCKNSNIKPSSATTGDPVEDIQNPVTPIVVPTYPLNPSFENWQSLGGTPNYPVSWTVIDYTAYGNVGGVSPGYRVKVLKETSPNNIIHGESSLRLQVDGPSTERLSIIQYLDVNQFQQGQNIDFSVFVKTDSNSTIKEVVKFWVKPWIPFNINDPNSGQISKIFALDGTVMPDEDPFNAQDVTYTYAVPLTKAEGWKKISFSVRQSLPKSQLIYLSIQLQFQHENLIDKKFLNEGQGIWVDAWNIGTEGAPANTGGTSAANPGSCASQFFTIIPAVSLAELCEKLKNPLINVPFKGAIKSIVRMSRPVRKDSELANDNSTCNTLIEEEFINIPECIDFAVDEKIEESWGGIAFVRDFFREVYPTGNTVGGAGISLGGSADAQIVPPSDPVPEGGLVLGGSAICYRIIGGISLYTFPASGGITLSGSAEYERSVGLFTTTASGGLNLSGAAAVKRFAEFYPFAMSGGLTIGGSARLRFILKHIPKFPFIFLGGTADAQIRRRKYPGSGGLTIGGTAEVKCSNRIYYTSGGITIGGGAKNTANPWLYNTSGGITLGGESKNLRKYMPTGGLSIGGSADVRVKLRQTGSGGVILSGEAKTISAFRRYTPTGGITLGGAAYARNSHIGLQLAGAAGAFMTELSLVPIFGVLPGEALTITASSATTNCSGRSVPLVLSLSHNLANARYLITFLKRNNLTLPARFNMSFRDVNDSWRENFHFEGLSADSNTRETWNVIFEMSCTSFIGGEDLGQYVWKFSMFVRRKITTTGQDFDTRLVFVIPAEAAFTKQGRVQTGTTTNVRLDVTYIANTQTHFVATAGGVVSQPTIFFDEVGLFTSQVWVKSPNLIISMSELTPVTTQPTFDVSPIFPEQPLLVQ